MESQSNQSSHQVRKHVLEARKSHILAIFYEFQFLPAYLTFLFLLDPQTGTSAGSLCSVAVSALVKTMDGKSATPFTFEMLREMVFNMTVGSVVDVTPFGIYNILNRNIPDGYILDTTPLRATLTGYLQQMGFKFMSDLYVPTCISTVDVETGLPVRICSDDAQAKNVQIIDVVMASAAMPVIFPTQTIPGFKAPFGSGVYVDGGVGIDMIPSDSAYMRDLDEVYIVTRQWELNNSNLLPLQLKNIKLLANAITTFSNLLQSSYFAGLSSAATARMTSYAYIPVLDVDFGVLEFGQGRLMYEMTKNWTRANAPICMNCL